MKVIYEGVFFNPEELKETLGVEEFELAREIKNPHVTFVFRPEKPASHLYGEKVRFKVTGYACDGKNEGVAVNLVSSSKKIEELYKRIAVPHITLSVSRDGKPVDTGRLTFHPIDGPEIQGTFLPFTGERRA